MDDILRQKPVIGMIHLMPLPGAPAYDKEGGIDRVIARAKADATALCEAGVHGIMIENFGDAPFFPDTVPAITIASMTRVITSIRKTITVAFGVNVLRNDGIAALSIANAVGASFVRVNILCGARIADQGLIESTAHLLLRHRARIGADHIKILADANVKHSHGIGTYNIDDEIKDLALRSGADAIIISGSGTGSPVSKSELMAARKISPKPVFIGSGLNADSQDLWEHCDGAIVGSAFKTNRDPLQPVDANLTKQFLDTVLK